MQNPSIVRQISSILMQIATSGQRAPALEILRAVHLLPPAHRSRAPIRQQHRHKFPGEPKTKLWGKYGWVSAQGADPHAVLADEELLVVIDRPLDGQLAPAEAGLAPAEEAVRALDLDEHDVAGALPRGVGLDVGDGHTGVGAGDGVEVGAGERACKHRPGARGSVQRRQRRGQRCAVNHFLQSEADVGEAVGAGRGLVEAAGGLTVGSRRGEHVHEVAQAVRSHRDLELTRFWRGFFTLSSFFFSNMIDLATTWHRLDQQGQEEKREEEGRSRQPLAPLELQLIFAARHAV